LAKTVVGIAYPAFSNTQEKEKAMTYAELLFSFDGRISRSPYWLKYSLPVMVVALVCWLLDVSLGTSFQPGSIGVVYVLFAIFNFYPCLAVNVKRCHDRGRSGWFLILALIPLVNLWPAIELGFLRGTLGPNQYGPDPLAPEQSQDAT
jgi:uncharacterized membrane protein YhaH (DUF805 family)